MIGNLITMKSIKDGDNRKSLPYLSYLKLNDDYFSNISSIELKDNIKENFKSMMVITSFEENDQIFFVITVESFDGEVSTKVIRWCPKMGIAGYTELSLTCSGIASNNEISYQVIFNSAVSGFVGHEAENKKKVLFLMMSKVDRISNPTASNSYSICAFQMKDILSQMTRIQSNCYSNGGQSIRPFWLKGVDYETCQSTIKQEEILHDILKQKGNFCGNKENPGVGPKSYNTEVIPVSTRNIMIVSRYPPILASYTYDSKTLAIVSTIEGEIYRIRCDLKTEEFGMALMMNSMGESSTGERLFSDIVVDHSQKYAFIAERDTSSSYGRITRVETTSCNTDRNRNNCQSCLSDPICGWCGVRCSTEKACTSGQWSRKSCLPVINEVINIVNENLYH